MLHQGGPYFASAGDDIKVWDSSSLQVVKQYNFHKSSVKDLAWSKDNSFLCSTAASGDKILLIDCNLPTKEKPKIISEHAIGEHQTCVRLSSSGRKLYSGGVDGAICVWDKETGKLRKIYKDSHRSPITCIALNGSETHVASGSNKGDVVIRNLSTGVSTKPECSVVGQAVRGMEFSPWKHSLLGMTMDDGSVNLWDTLQGKLYHSFSEIHSGSSMDLAFSSFNDLVLASVGLDKYLMIFDVKKHKYLNKVKADQPLTSLTFLHDGYTIFAGSSMGNLYQFDMRHFSRYVTSVAAHSSSVQRLVVQNLAKNRVKSGRERVPNRKTLGDESSLNRQKSLQSEGNSSDDTRIVDGRGDAHFHLKHRSSSSDPSSASSEDHTPYIRGVVNGNRNLDKTHLKPKENSTPTGGLKQEFPPHLDDMGGLISPLREEVFDVPPTTSTDVSILPHDPSLMGATFSSSVDTIGSYCDDILSPIASNPLNGKPGRISAGTQIHSKTSPHPLRQSYSAVPPEKMDPSFKLRNSAPALRSLKPSNAKIQPVADAEEDAGGRASAVESTKLSSLPPKKSSPVESRKTRGLTNGAGSGVSKDQINHTTPPQSLLNSHPSSHPPTTSTHHYTPPTTASSSGLQFQAEYIRNTVKEAVDELGDDLRRQMNGMMSAMVKISLEQEEVMRKLLEERKCDVNQQLLRECERLRMENERLKMKAPFS